MNKYKIKKGAITLCMSDHPSLTVKFVNQSGEELTHLHCNEVQFNALMKAKSVNFKGSSYTLSDFVYDLDNYAFIVTLS